MHPAGPAFRRFIWLVPLFIVGLTGCERRGACAGACGTLVFVTPNEPDILLPPVSHQVGTRDIGDQVFLKLADIGLSTNTVGDGDFQPQIAARWEWEAPLTLVFHLDSRARWHDGRPVTAADVAFTFDAYGDPVLASSFRSALRRIASVTARDSATAVFQFRERYGEMFYDAVYHMRILPAHLLRGVPREQWKTAPFGRQPVGNGPYRFVSWRAGESLELGADSTFFLGRPGIARLIWRFTPDLQVAVNQLVAGEGDALEYLGTPDNVSRARAAPHLTIYPYRGSTYGYLGFNLAASGDPTRPHPVLGDRDVRRALTMAIDRARLLSSVFGDLAKVPPGPVPQIWSIWDAGIRQLPHDTAQAAQLLAARGWRDSDGDGIRDRAGQRLSFRLLVPSTSGVRKQYARLLQEQLRAVGVQMEILEVEPSVVQERLAAGRFDAAMFGWSADPTPSSSVVELWTRAGFGGQNSIRYANPAFDRLVAQATGADATSDQARAAWRAAIETLNDDAPAIFLFAPDNVAAVHARVDNVRVRPDSWWALVRTWRIPPGRLIDRDRVAR
ncbi:MAG TPA: peptide ABC transporter substrate-binding protein [Gemmatimonadales bacterium]|nr:peptide ABC transporter substrate-binding protein [Gemmatimonadales bacterium]